MIRLMTVIALSALVSLPHAASAAPRKNTPRKTSKAYQEAKTACKKEFPNLRSSKKLRGCIKRKMTERQSSAGDV